MLFMAFGWSNDGYDPGALDLFYQDYDVPKQRTLYALGHSFHDRVSCRAKKLDPKRYMEFLVGAIDAPFFSCLIYL